MKSYFERFDVTLQKICATAIFFSLKKYPTFENHKSTKIHSNWKNSGLRFEEEIEIYKTHLAVLKLAFSSKRYDFLKNSYFSNFSKIHQLPWSFSRTPRRRFSKLLRYFVLLDQYYIWMKGFVQKRFLCRDLGLWNRDVFMKF